MARKALRISTVRKQQSVEKAIKGGKKTRFSTRAYNRCPQCGKINGYMRRFDMCRICFRELASEGLIMGVKKSSW
jgi:small subunit ribosomal protein S14